jgi:conjugal transfer ATP-binding protein TraC
MREQLFKANRVVELFPTLAYDHDNAIFLLEDKSLAFSFICRPMSGADDSVQSRINNFLNFEWPDDTIIQFTLFSSDNVNQEINDYLSRRISTTNHLLVKAVENRAEFLKEATRTPLGSTSICVRNIYLVISVKLPIKGMMPDEWEMEKASDLQVISNKSLETIGLNPKAMDNNLFIKVMDSLINHGEDAIWQENRTREALEDITLNSQILDADKSIRVDEKGLWIGDQRLKTISVKKFPEVVYPGFGVNFMGDMMTGARGIRSQFIISANVFYPSKHKTKAAIDKKRQFTVSQANGPLSKFVPILKAKEHGFDVLNRALDDGDSPVKLYFSICVFGNTEEEATEAASTVRSYYSELGFQLVVDKYFVLPLFLNSLPHGADREAIRDTFRYRTFATRQVAPLLPLFGDWKGTGNAVMNFISRNGQLMNVDLFDSGTNYNVVIAAQSGAGKSFFTSNMITNYLSIGGKVWVIDVGRSYLKLSETYDGDFVHFGKDSDICLNPFQLVKNFDEESDILTGLVSAMAAPTEKLSDQQVSNLKRIMKELWIEHGNEMTIDLIHERMLASEDRRLKDVGEQLYSFTSKGDYGKYFVGQNNVSFQENFTVLELDDLQGREHLMQVVLLQLIYQIQQDMYLGEKDRPKVVVIDEAWSLLSKGNIAEFIEHGYRRFRKYGGAACTVTQSINDLYSNRVGVAIAENSANMYLLRQKSEAINQLKEQNRLPLSAGGYELLKTVHTSSGEYSEIFFSTEYGAGIGRLIVDPFEVLLYSTKATDVHAIEKKKAKGLSTADAIREVLEERAK